MLNFTYHVRGYNCIDSTEIFEDVSIQICQTQNFKLF